MGGVCDHGLKTAGGIPGKFVRNSQGGSYGRHAAAGAVSATILGVIDCLHIVCHSLSETVVSAVERQMVYGGGTAFDLLVFGA